MSSLYRCIVLCCIVLDGDYHRLLVLELLCWLCIACLAWLVEVSYRYHNRYLFLKLFRAVTVVL